MFDPNNRSLLTDMLQPPPGFTLEHAVGTTFTLDLATALTVPLSFASRSFAEHSTVGILAALARYTDRIDVFAQAGVMRVGVNSELISLLEEVVHPVQPTRGLFHPKVWVLEFSNDEKRAYRFLSLSRNLTEDRSWDLAVRLDGVPCPLADEAECAEQNQPIASLLTQLPQMAVANVADNRVNRISALAERILTVRWEAPEGLSQPIFHYLDGTGPGLPNFHAAEALVISPFVTQGGLDLVRRNVRHTTTLLSRPTTINRLPASSFDKRLKTLVFDGALDEAADSADGEATHTYDSLTGLHAKALFVRDRSRHSQATAYIGSANFTQGGLCNNIEMMVEFNGHRRDIGPDEVYEQLQPLLEEYTRDESDQETVEEVEQSRLEARMRGLAAGRFHARVHGSSPYELAVWADETVTAGLQALAADGVEVTWRLHSRPNSPTLALQASETGAAHISDLALTEITPFLSLTATRQIEDLTVEASTLVLAQLHDDPSERRNAVMAKGIADGDTFLKLLALLLSPTSFALGASNLRGNIESGGWSSEAFISGLFETLLKSLARGDDGLDVVQQIFAELESEETELEFPRGFEGLWQNVWAARQQSLQSAIK